MHESVEGLQTWICARIFGGRPLTTGLRCKWYQRLVPATHQTKLTTEVNHSAITRKQSHKPEPEQEAHHNREQTTMHLLDDLCCQQQQHQIARRTLTIMKQQHEAVECDFAFFSPGITTASFALAAWGSSSDSDKPTQEPSFPEFISNENWDDGDTDADDEDDKSEYLSIASCQDSGECEYMQDDDDATLFNEIDDYLSSDPLSLPHDERDPRLVTRKVHFGPEVVSKVCYYERAALADHKNMYYTAHELQRMIDDFVAQGGRSLFS